MIAIVDYGIGNLRSVEKALQRVGARAMVTADPAALDAAHGVVLPGVGIGRGGQVGAGAVVTGDLPDFAVATGVPARVRRLR